MTGCVTVQDKPYDVDLKNRVLQIASIQIARSAYFSGEKCYTFEYFEDRKAIRLAIIPQILADETGKERMCGEGFTVIADRTAEQGEFNPLIVPMR